MLTRTQLLPFALAASVLCADGMAQIGSVFCAGEINSTGTPSTITAAGSTDVSQNDVTISVTDLPQNQFGLFITSQVPTLVTNPGGSNGNLCIGTGLGRFNNNIVNSGTTGDVDIVLDLTSIPNSTTFYAVLPGDTVYFQFWHRDTAAPGFSNLSPGLEIGFDNASTISFQNDIYPMLTQPNINADACTVCHGGLCGFDLGTDAMMAYNALVNAPSGFCCGGQTYVVPGDSANSLLFQKLTAPACGGTMPTGGTFAGDTNTVRDWIDAGAPF